MQELCNQGGFKKSTTTSYSFGRSNAKLEKDLEKFAKYHYIKVRFQDMRKSFQSLSSTKYRNQTFIELLKRALKQNMVFAPAGEKKCDVHASICRICEVDVSR